ncbi:unnamed protein product, partial [marine sediment metagenome]
IYTPVLIRMFGGGDASGTLLAEKTRCHPKKEMIYNG